jgi:hypothetical protein
LAWRSLATVAAAAAWEEFSVSEFPEWLLPANRRGPARRRLFLEMPDHFRVKESRRRHRSDDAASRAGAAECLSDAKDGGNDGGRDGGRRSRAIDKCRLTAWKGFFDYARLLREEDFRIVE